jgi:hypothetical protein
VSRFLANNQLRAVSNANWPVDYYVGGPACSELTPDAYKLITDQIHKSRDKKYDLLKIRRDETFQCADRPGGNAAGGSGGGEDDGKVMGVCPLDTAAKMSSGRCLPNDLGTFLVPTWDAVMLADAMLPDEPPAGKDYLTSLELPPTTFSTGKLATVRQGRLLDAVVTPRMWHVDPLNDPSYLWERASDGTQ